MSSPSALRAPGFVLPDSLLPPAADDSLAIASMKIGIFTELFPPSIGGQEVRFAELSEALRDRGHEVSVFCVAHAAGLSAEEDWHGVRIHRHPEDPSYREPRIKALKRSPWTMLRYGWWCRRMASRHRFDLHLYNEWPLAHILLAPRAARCRAVGDWCEIRYGWVYRLLQTYLPRMMAWNMAVSPAVQAYIRDRSRKRTLYVPSGIVLQRYRQAPRERRGYLLYLGRIAEHKNLPLLIEAFERIGPGDPGLGLKIAGRGPDLEPLRERAAASPLADRIEVLGAVSEEEKIDLLAGARWLVIPSKREGFPRVVAEAMASGLPVVTPDFKENGTTVVVRHYGCGLVTAPTANALADAIVEGEQDWGTLSRSGLQHAPELDWNVLAQAVESFVTDCGE